MTDFKFRGMCFKCKRNKFFIRKREINLPIHKIVKSRELFCTPCFKLLKVLEKQP